jgi:hypothetical protein
MAYPDPRFRSPTILLFSQKKPLEKEGLRVSGDKYK